MAMLAVGVSKLPSVAATRVHSWGHNLKVLKVDALSISAKVVNLKAAWHSAVLVLVVPFVGIDLAALVVLEGSVSGGIKRASPL